MRLSHLVLGAIGLGCLSHLSLQPTFGAEPSSNSAQTRAHVGFSSTLNDAEVEQLLRSYNVRPSAVFIWSTGMSGTYRSYQDETATALLKKARERSATTFRKALKGNTVRLNRFLESHTEQQIAESQELQTQARSLLNIRAQFEGALSTAQEGRPLVYAVDITGDRAEIQRVSASSKVKAFQEVSAQVVSGVIARSEREAAARVIKPQAYSVEYRDPVVQTVSGSDLYQVLQAAVGSEEPIHKLISGIR